MTQVVYLKFPSSIGHPVLLSATSFWPLLSADLHKTGVQPTFAEWGLGVT